MLEKIVSGGQTGVDRAALDVALALNIPCGGWCPRGRKAEDGVIAAQYPLKETPSREYSQRTEWNVRDSDATLVLTRGRPTQGTALTVDVARRLERPCLVVDMNKKSCEEPVVAWLTEHDIRVLNVAGPREEKNPGIYKEASQVLRRTLSSVR